MRQLLFIGVIVGSAVSVPLVYQANPDAFRRVGPRVAPAPEVVPAVRQASAGNTSLGRKVRIEQDRRGHFAAAFRINGREVEAMVDTGATVMALNASTARRVGISLSPSDFTHPVTTANGETRAALVTIDRVQIGRIAVERVPAVVLEDGALAGALVGINFLERLSGFGVEGDAMVLRQ